MVQPLWKMVWKFLTELNILIPHIPAVMLLGIYPKELKTYTHRLKNLHMDVYSSFIHICQNLETTKMSFRR